MQHSGSDPVNLSTAGMMNVFAVNVAAPLKLVALLRPSLSRAKGAVLNVSSETGSIAKITKPSKFAYAASKAALNHVTRNLSFHLKSEGVGVYLCEPGWMRTEMGSKSAPHDARDVAKWIFSEPAPWKIESCDGYAAHGRDYDVCPW
jgi:NAD(P)-dependent dehydrogenase (short-subunit alcohol dehydrogenase family)